MITRPFRISGAVRRLRQACRSRTAVRLQCHSGRDQFDSGFLLTIPNCRRHKNSVVPKASNHANFRMRGHMRRRLPDLRFSIYGAAKPRNTLSDETASHGITSSCDSLRLNTRFGAQSLNGSAFVDMSKINIVQRRHSVTARNEVTAGINDRSHP